MFNVHHGGTLIQILSAIRYASGSVKVRRSYGFSSFVTIAEGSRLQRIVGDNRLIVNSSHHQAIGRLGRDLVATAFSEDGVIEAVECAKTGFLGVQWHPESLQYQCPRHAGLFEAFVEML